MKTAAAWSLGALGYRALQYTLAPGATRHLSAHVEQLLDGWRPNGPALDVGCADASLLGAIGVNPIGIDWAQDRLRRFAQTSPGMAVQADAKHLPIRTSACELVFNCGLLHHLSDTDVRSALAEMRRVLAPGGRLLLFDAVLPEPAWQRPLAALIRACDRGSFMRTQAALEDLLKAALPALVWGTRRVSYSATGLEGLFFMSQASPTCR